VAAGSYRVEWDGRDTTERSVAAGVYFVAVTTPDGVGSEKLTLLR
jgi:hypothetical protein